MSWPTFIDIAKTTNAFADNEKPVDMQSKIYENFPALTPVLSISTKLASDTTFNSRVDWTEKEEIPTKAYNTVAAASATGASTLTFGVYGHLRNHMLLQNNRTLEVIKIEGYTTRDATVDVIRAWGGSTPAAINAGDEWEIMTSSYHEAYDETNPLSIVNTNHYNFTAEIVEFVQTSKRAMHEKTWFSGPGGKRLENQQNMFRAFKIKFEKTLLYSRRADVASTQTGYTTSNVKTMGGLVEKLYNGTNYMDVGGPLTESIFDSWLVNIYSKMPDTTNLLCVCAPRVYASINRMCKGMIQLSPNSKQYGMALKQYQGAITVDLVPHPLLTGPYLGGWMFLLDLSYWKVIWQQSPILELDTYTKRAGFIEDKYSAMATCILGSEVRHGFATGITG